MAMYSFVLPTKGLLQKIGKFIFDQELDFYLPIS